MAAEKSGLKRPKPPVDLFTLEPEPELVDTGEKQSEPVDAKPKKRITRRKQTRPTSQATEDDVERIKTSVELLPETIELLHQLKTQYRQEKRRLLPMWKILQEAVADYAKKHLQTKRETQSQGRHQT